MDKNVSENNQVTLTGQVTSNFEFIHQRYYGENFYRVFVTVCRTKGGTDIIPVIVSEKLIEPKNCIGQHIRIVGQYHSNNYYSNGKRHLMLFVYAMEWNFVDADDTNDVYLDGFLCKPPVLRTTPLGRIITDLNIAVNRPNGTTDYIPCICWNRVARFASTLSVGHHIQCWGRIQSREYSKKINEFEYETYTAYELSIHKLITAEKNR